VIGKTNYDLMPVELARERQEEDDAVLRAGEPIEFTQRIPIPNHDSREWLSVKYPVVDAEGKRYAAGFAFDVTERAEAEAALRQAKEAPSGEPPQGRCTR
jgi:PAS domain-containing protein